MRTVLVIAPHPDDEVLGVGGTILRHLAGGDAVHVVICTRGEEERFGKEQVNRVQKEARDAHAFMGVSESHFLNLPAARLDTIPGSEVNSALGGVFKAVGPDVLYLPHVGDVHLDHQIIFRAAMVCSRPVGSHFPKRILAYETVSETDWYAAPLTPVFAPNVYIDITAYIEKKLHACTIYASQVRTAPDQRSIEALRALAVTRGHAVGFEYAEAFVLVRELTA